MSISPWMKSAAPWFHLLVASPGDTCNWLWAIANDSKHRVATRLIRGRKAETKGQFLDEIAAALQFPPHFGENWDALHDCLADLSWIYADAIVLCIADADRLLAKAPGELETSIGILQSAAKEWNEPDKPKSPRAFHVVVQVAAGQESAVKSAWQGAGVKLEPVPSGKKP
jgi:RNAse (barnase) inhibitor barstar